MFLRTVAKQCNRSHFTKKEQKHGTKKLRQNCKFLKRSFLNGARNWTRTSDLHRVKMAF